MGPKCHSFYREVYLWAGLVVLAFLFKFVVLVASLKFTSRWVLLLWVRLVRVVLVALLTHGLVCSIALPKVSEWD